MSNVDSVKIVGIKKSPSSKNPEVTYYNYYYLGNYTEYDINNSEVFGIPAGAEFSNIDIGCNVGDIVEFKYRKGFQDKAQLIGCTILQAANAGK